MAVALVHCQMVPRVGIPQDAARVVSFVETHVESRYRRSELSGCFRWVTRRAAVGRETRSAEVGESLEGGKMDVYGG